MTEYQSLHLEELVQMLQRKLIQRRIDALGEMDYAEKKQAILRIREEEK